MKWLSILALLVALSAHALSVKDWVKKSDADQLGYLGFCVVGLMADVAKSDPALALKIKSWYGDKPPGQKYTDGFVDLLTRIVQLKRRAETDKTVDLSKIQIEDIVYSVTAEKFKLPPREAPAELGDFKDAAPAARPVPPAPAPATSPSAPPPPRTQPIMIGKIDVSHFAGLKAGDTPAQAELVYGPANGAMSSSSDMQSFGGPGPDRMIVSYSYGRVESVALQVGALEFARSQIVNDPLFDLFGRSKADAVEILGQPTGKVSNNGNDFLYWYFPSHGRNDERADWVAAYHKVLVLSFKPGYGCDWMKVSW